MRIPWILASVSVGMGMGILVSEMDRNELGRAWGQLCHALLSGPGHLV